jgi:hypothetical protein
MRWRKSTYSGANENCVEVALAPVVRIRDTKDRPGGTLAISTRSWDALVRGFNAELPC